MELKSHPDAPWNKLCMGISGDIMYHGVSHIVWMNLVSYMFFWAPLEQLGVENGSGRDAVHGVVNCRYWRSSARIRVRSALRFLPWKLLKSIKCMAATSLKCWVWWESVGPCSDKSKDCDCDQLWPIYLLPFAGVLGECFAWWRMSLELRLLACGCAWIVSVANGSLRLLLFLIFEANLRSCAQNSISNRLIVAYNLIDLIGLMRQQPNLCSEIR